MKTLCPSIGECQVQEAGAGGGGGDRGFSERKQGKEIAFEMLIKKISNKNKQKNQTNKITLVIFSYLWRHTHPNFPE